MRDEEGGRRGGGGRFRCGEKMVCVAQLVKPLHAISRQSE